MAEDNAERKEVNEEDLKNMSPEEIAELQKQNCIFCKIANKEIPAKILHEDSDVICVLDINPASEGHILVYPKKHYMILPHIPDDMLAKLFSTVKLMSNTLLKSLQCKGTSVFIANGMAAGQKAPHVLIHVFPRRENDGLLAMPRYEITEEQASKIKSTLKPVAQKMFGGSLPHDKSSHHDKPSHKTDKQVHKQSMIESKEDIEVPSEEYVEEKEESRAMSRNHDEDSKDDSNEESGSGEEVDTESAVDAGEEHVDKRSKPDKAHKHEVKTRPGKVDLNDIARLFGG